MKKYMIFSMLLVFSFSSMKGQVFLHGDPMPSVLGENAFLDASFIFSIEESFGKGLIFPATNLEVFEFILDGYATDFMFEHWFHGMVIFNVVSGTSNYGVDNPNVPDVGVPIVPGFYFFYNPNGASNMSVAEGTWLPLGGGGNSWDVGGNLKDNSEPQVLGVYENTPDGDAPPIIVWSGVNGVSTPIMHIGRPNGNGTRALEVNLED